MLKKSLLIGGITSIYFIPEIYNNSSSILIFSLAYLTQVLHDGVCVLIILLFLSSQRKNNIIYLNILHSIIMICFCYYKRCILTLVYNHILNLDMCKRYIPIWQRGFNVLIDSAEICNKDEYKNTYLWLNNHIFQSIAVLMANCNKLLFLEYKFRNRYYY
jgi:hypothetical protein